MSEEVVAKRQKLAKETTKDEASSAIKTCAHLVKRKKRNCKMIAAKGSEYCAEHEPALANGTGEAEHVADSVRIPCPLDGKHTVYKKNLQKHLKICNAREKSDEPAFIQKGINAGEPIEEADDWKNIKLNDLKDEEFYSVIEKVKEIHEKYIKDQIETLNVHHKSLDEELAKEAYGKESRKHLEQTAALLGLLETEQQLQNSTTFIEFGAGKGQLAFYLAQILQHHENSQVVLLDRMSLRHKKDNKIADRALVQRIRVDIADFCINKLEILEKTKRNVAVSKHLCGAATDLTLRCITQSPATDTLSTSHTEFIMIALCCHHRCEWRSFVGKEFFQKAQITPRQFVIITKMVSWAICGTGMSRERRRALEDQSISPEEIYEITSAQRLPLAERESIGFMCKRVLDYARLDYLRQHDYEASLKYYVPRDITLENVCLIAKKLK